MLRGMTTNPPTLQALAAYWVARGGVNLGVVGDDSHVGGGTSYHLGRSQLSANAYSIRTTRDRLGLSEAASAIDLGKLDGTLTGLRVFSVWLVAYARQNGEGTNDIREIIYSPDGTLVLRWDRERGFASPPQGGEADASHRTHTHISFYRDAEARDHTTAFRPYFGEAMWKLSINDETDCLMDLPVGADWLDVNGTSKLGDSTIAYVGRYSPFGFGGGLRAMYASIAGVRRIVVVKPTRVYEAPNSAAALQLRLDNAGKRLAQINVISAGKV